MSPWSTYFPIWRSSFPRVSGDEPRMVDELEAMAMFSPRERG